LIDEYTTDERSHDISEIHNIRNVSIDESDIFMIFSDDDHLKNGTEYALENITEPDESDENSHISRNEGACETQERTEDPDDNQLFIGEIFKPEIFEKYSLIYYHNQSEESQNISAEFSCHPKLMMQE